MPATCNDHPVVFCDSTDTSYSQRSSRCTHLQPDRHQLTETLVQLHLSTTRPTSATSNDRLVAFLRLDHTSYQHHPSSENHLLVSNLVQMSQQKWEDSDHIFGWNSWLSCPGQWYFWNRLWKEMVWVFSGNYTRKTEETDKNSRWGEDLKVWWWEQTKIHSTVCQCGHWNLYHYWCCACGVMVIVIGNGHGDTSPNPGRDWLHFT